MKKISSTKVASRAAIAVLSAYNTNLISVSQASEYLKRLEQKQRFLEAADRIEKNFDSIKSDTDAQFILLRNALVSFRTKYVKSTNDNIEKYLEGAINGAVAITKFLYLSKNPHEKSEAGFDAGYNALKMVSNFIEFQQAGNQYDDEKIQIKALLVEAQRRLNEYIAARKSYAQLMDEAASKGMLDPAQSVTKNTLPSSSSTQSKNNDNYIHKPNNTDGKILSHMKGGWQMIRASDGSPSATFLFADYPGLKSLTLYCSGANSLGMRADLTKKSDSIIFSSGGDAAIISLDGSGNFEKKGLQAFVAEVEIIEKESNSAEYDIQIGSISRPYKIDGMTAARKQLRQDCSSPKQSTDIVANAGHGVISGQGSSNDGTMLKALERSDVEAMKAALRASLPSWVICNQISPMLLSCGKTDLISAGGQRWSLTINMIEPSARLSSAMFADNKAKASNEAIANATISVARGFGIINQDLNNCLGDRRFENVMFRDWVKSKHRVGGLLADCKSGQTEYRHYFMNLSVGRNSSF